MHFYKYYFNGLYAKYVMSPSNAVELETPLVRSILGTIKLMYLCVHLFNHYSSTNKNLP